MIQLPRRGVGNLDELELSWLQYELECRDPLRQRSAVLTLLREGSAQVRELLARLPLDAETVNEILDMRPDTLEEILRRLWEFRGGSTRRGSWPYDQGALLGLLQRGGAAQNGAEVLAAWGWDSFGECHHVVRILGESTERLETYLTLLEDWRQETGWTKYPIHTVAGRAAALAAAKAAAALHP